MLIQDWEMGGNNDLICSDCPACSNDLSGHQLPHLGMFKDPQALSNRSQKPQGMELRLLWEAHRTCHRERQRQL